MEHLDNHVFLATALHGRLAEEHRLPFKVASDLNEVAEGRMSLRALYNKYPDLQSLAEEIQHAARSVLSAGKKTRHAPGASVRFTVVKHGMDEDGITPRSTLRNAVFLHALASAETDLVIHADHVELQQEGHMKTYPPATRVACCGLVFMIRNIARDGGYESDMMHMDVVDPATGRSSTLPITGMNVRKLCLSLNGQWGGFSTTYGDLYTFKVQTASSREFITEPKQFYRARGHPRYLRDLDELAREERFMPTPTLWAVTNMGQVLYTTFASAVEPALDATFTVCVGDRQYTTGPFALGVVEDADTHPYGPRQTVEYATCIQESTIGTGSEPVVWVLLRQRRRAGGPAKAILSAFSSRMGTAMQTSTLPLPDADYIHDMHSRLHWLVLALGGEFHVYDVSGSQALEKPVFTYRVPAALGTTGRGYLQSLALNRSEEQLQIVTTEWQQDERMLTLLEQVCVWDVYS